jgi:hypothetical protein
VLPKVTTHAEFVHVEPEGQTSHDGPQALLLLVVSEHAPPQQFPPAHEVPSGWVPVSEQVGCPELHDVAPVWQSLGGVPGVHEVPAVQARQEPSLQTRFVPHEVPSGTLPVAPQVDCPELHDVVPV